jgi:preprotein translocase subunit SecY
VLLCVSQALGFAAFLERVSLSSPAPIVDHPGLMFRIGALVMLTAGTTCLMFISDQISRHRMGNGMLIVFVAGNLAALPGIVGPLFSGAADPFAILGVLAINTAIVAAISHGYQNAIAREVAA